MARLSRRDFLKLALAGGVVAGCSPVIDTQLRPPLPADAHTIDAQTPTRTVHLLNRATHGATPALVAEVETMGVAAWIDQQLRYEQIDDWRCDLRLRRFDTIALDEVDLRSFGRLPDKRYVANELVAATLMRMIYSRRHLYEVLVHFWSDHFSIYHFKDACYTLKTVDDREVIRPHALGYFGDMLRASAHSPAMLVYLDNIANEKSHPNENYAREIMELHTLGVDGGYTEQDVQEVARCFTGWTINDNHQFEYRDAWHDKGEKRVLGHVIAAGGGKSDGDRVLDILIEHPSTARYIATKLARRFVADDPPASVVNALVEAWHSSARGTQGGDIRAMMRALFDHPDFWDAPRKFKRPLELVVSALRSTHASYNGRASLIDRLQDMGQRPFGRQTPDGYPDVARAWGSNLAPRWNLALDLVQDSDRLSGVGVPLNQWRDWGGDDPIRYVGRALLMRDLTTSEYETIAGVIGKTRNLSPYDMGQTIALLLSTPAFQWR
mgnify:CR=1 FL=1